MELINKHEWFKKVMEEKENFFDVGITACFVSDQGIILFWKCIRV